MFIKYELLKENLLRGMFGYFPANMHTFNECLLANYLFKHFSGKTGLCKKLHCIEKVIVTTSNRYMLASIISAVGLITLTFTIFVGTRLAALEERCLLNKRDGLPGTLERKPHKVVSYDECITDNMKQQSFNL